MKNLFKGKKKLSCYFGKHKLIQQGNFFLHDNHIYYWHGCKNCGKTKLLISK